jgi:hypothetical protein
VESTAQARQHAGIGARAEGWPHQHIDRPEVLLLEPEGFPDAALEAIAVGCIGRVLFRDEHAEARAAGVARRKEKRESIEAAPHPVAQQVLELCLAPQPAIAVQTLTFAVRG